MKVLLYINFDIYNYIVILFKLILFLMNASVLGLRVFDPSLNCIFYILESSYFKHYATKITVNLNVLSKS